jgi:(1->4)-alpha-D-glucan 1-alpha-D-glucosylmutase
MEIPRATYRIQFGPGFGFGDAVSIVPYLASLGVSHIYASPVFRARRGSSHGYDIVDPNRLNPVLGTADEFDALIEVLHRSGMLYMQDIVPNHLAYDRDNWMLMDLLETETTPIFSSFFDIDWAATDGEAGGRLLAPFLARPYHECLAEGEIRIILDEAGLGVCYDDTRLPLRMGSYPEVLGHGLARSRPDRSQPDPSQLDGSHPDPIQPDLRQPDHTGDAGPGPLRPLVDLIGTLEVMIASTSVSDHYEVIPRLRKQLWSLYQTSSEIRDHVDRTLDTFNKSGALPGRNLLDDLLSAQRFKLACKHDADLDINYRRFFTVNSLIAVNMQYPQVFEYLHRLTLELVNAGKISGLRIDHIDGLYDPASYLESLRAGAGDAYIVAEKVLSPGEDLPNGWMVQGTTGYDFLNRLNGLFCDPSGETALGTIFSGFTAVTNSCEDIVYDSKRLMVESCMRSEIDHLARLARSAAGSLAGHSDAGIKEALVEILACFTVYRTYGDGDGLSARDLAIWQKVLEGALKRRGDLAREIGAFEKAALSCGGAGAGHAPDPSALGLILRLQQYTGPAMAKGFEDTALYHYNRLISLNEVGGDPGTFGTAPDEFHGFIKERMASRPASMNATSTHDAKRGEDARARINVLSEIPDQWEARVKAWRSMNRKHTAKCEGWNTPDANLEYLLYQSLVGAWPFEVPGGETSGRDTSDSGVSRLGTPGTPDFKEFVGRFKSYILKAAREAKTRTSWDDPDSSTEKSIGDFVEAILDDSRSQEFLADFRQFARRISHFGILNSLSQTLIKLAAPGVPDIYQGSECWNLSLVDPDNRRPVDFRLLEKHLESILEAYSRDRLGTIADLLRSPADGRLKLFLTNACLKARKENIAVFSEGSYIPIESRGELSQHVIAFARRHGSGTALAVAPRLLTRVVAPGEMPLGGGVWKNTEIVLPDAVSCGPAASGPKASGPVDPGWRDAITGEVIAAEGTLRLAEVLRHFPVALLLNSRKGIDEKR